jgi:ribonuclease HII
MLTGAGRLAGGAGAARPGDQLMRTAPWRQPAHTPRRTGGLTSYERVLARAGLSPVAGIDEAGRGACAGPLVVGAVILDPRKSSKLTLLADSKALTPAVREIVYGQVLSAALSWHAVVIPPGDIDRLGLHVCNLAGMRRALAGLTCRPGYVLTDGFAVRGLATPALGMWQGDEVAACVAAASVIAKVTRDRLMTALDERYPGYGFAAHKGYSTRAHMQALAAHGPCPEHRMSFANVNGRCAPAGGQDPSLEPGLEPGQDPGQEPGQDPGAGDLLAEVTAPPPPAEDWLPADAADLRAEQPMMKENGPMVDLIAGPCSPVQVRQEGRA